MTASEPRDGLTDLRALPVQSKAEIFQRLQRSRKSLAGFGVRRCGVFGSFARGTMQPESDVDVLVVFEPELKTFANFMDLGFFLEELLGRRVDLLTPEALSPFLGPKILAEVEYVPFS